MHKRRLGRTGLQIAPLVFGGNVFGWTADAKTSFDLLDRFLEAGFNTIDTADVWTDGSRDVRVSGWSIHRVALTAGYAAAVAGAEAGGWLPSAPRRLKTPQHGDNSDDNADDGSAADQRFGRAGA